MIRRRSLNLAAVFTSCAKPSIKNAYRVVHVVSLKKAVYVLHAFMKKSKSGIGLPKTDANLIQSRLKQARKADTEDDHE